MYVYVPIPYCTITFASFKWFAVCHLLSVSGFGLQPTAVIKRGKVILFVYYSSKTKNDERMKNGTEV